MRGCLTLQHEPASPLTICPTLCSFFHRPSSPVSPSLPPCAQPAWLTREHLAPSRCHGPDAAQQHPGPVPSSSRSRFMLHSVSGSPPRCHSQPLPWQQHRWDFTGLLKDSITAVEAEDAERERETRCYRGFRVRTELQVQPWGSFDCPRKRKPGFEFWVLVLDSPKHRMSLTDHLETPRRFLLKETWKRWRSADQNRKDENVSFIIFPDDGKDNSKRKRITKKMGKIRGEKEKDYKKKSLS